MTPGCSLWSPAASHRKGPSVRSPSHTQLLTQQTVLWPPNRQTLGSPRRLPQLLLGRSTLQVLKPFLLESFRLGEAVVHTSTVLALRLPLNPALTPGPNASWCPSVPGKRGLIPRCRKGPHNRQVALVCVPLLGRGAATPCDPRASQPAVPAQAPADGCLAGLQMNKARRCGGSARLQQVALETKECVLAGGPTSGRSGQSAVWARFLRAFAAFRHGPVSTRASTLDGDRGPLNGKVRGDTPDLRG